MGAPCVECALLAAVAAAGDALTNPVWWIAGALVAAGVAALRAPPGRWRK